MRQRTTGGHSVSVIGLGGMPLSIEGRPDEVRATVHAALDAGVTLIDTADVYHRDADELGHDGQGVRASSRRRRDRPVPVPPPRPGRTVRRVGGCAP